MAVEVDEEEPFTGGAGGVNCTVPGSGKARPREANGELVSYGKDRETVVGASGSFLERKSCHAAAPVRFPKRRWNDCRVRAELTSLPPPLPKMPPIREAVAITSVGVKCWGTLPKAAYSPGSLLGALAGFVAMSM